MTKLTIIIFLLVTFLVTNVWADDIKHNGTTFYISNKVQKENSILIKLILNTESMDDDERQYWFDIMPSMKKNQISNLLVILETEKKKLLKLEVKYQKEIKDLNKKHLKEWKEFQLKKFKEKINKAIKNDYKDIDGLYYLSFQSKDLPRIKISPITKNPIDDAYIPDDDDDIKFSRYEQMILVEFGKKLISNISKYKKLYGDTTFEVYIDKVQGSAISLNDIDTLTLMYMNKVVEKNDVVSSMYLAKGDYKSLAVLYEKRLDTEKWKRSIFFTLLDLTKWRKKNNCKEKCAFVLKKYISRMLKEDFPFKHEKTSSYFHTQLIILDLILYFNKDIISSEFEKKSNDYISFYTRNDTSYIKKDRDWYFKLSNSFFNNSIESIYNIQLSKYLNSSNIYSIEGELLEVSAYTAYDLIKNNREREALQILLSAKGLGNSIYSEAYKYIENDLVDFLIDVASEPHKYKKGHLFLGTYQTKGDSREFKPFGKKYGIVIGISDYKYLEAPSDGGASKENKQLHDLKYAHKDALAFKKFLQSPRKSGGGWEILSFIGDKADMVSVRKEIDRILTKANSNDLVYIYFSGHARLNPNNNEEVYLLTQDFTPENPYSGIPYTWLVSTINRSKAKHLITFIDACRSGTVKNAKGVASVDQDLLNNVLQQSPTKVIFTSGSGSQISYEDEKFEKGIFTHFLLKGLYGDSIDSNKDGFVNLNELEDYTSNKVSSYTRERKGVTYQRPRVSNLDPTFSVQFPLSIR